MATRQVAHGPRQVGALGEAPVEQAGVREHVEQRDGVGPVAGVRQCLGGEAPRPSPMSPRRRVRHAADGEQGGAAGVVGGEPVEETLRPDKRLVDEPALRVELRCAANSAASSTSCRAAQP